MNPAGSSLEWSRQGDVGEQTHYSIGMLPVMAHNVEIKEAYRGYVPPAWVRPTVERILSRVPDRYLLGLRTIVLTAAGGLSHDRRRAKTLSRKKKVKVRESWGLYHQKWKGEPAWIEIFVDNIVSWYGRKIRLGLIRDLAIGGSLLHELGHHIHATRAPEFREREDVAERWRAKLMGLYWMRRYWYFFPLVVVVYRLCKRLKRIFGFKRGKRARK